MCFVDIPWKHGAIKFPGRVVKRPRRKVLFLTDHEILERRLVDCAVATSSVSRGCRVYHAVLARSTADKLIRNRSDENYFSLRA